MSDVTAGQNESFDGMLKRFNKRVQQDGTLSEVRRRQYFEKPSVKRKKKMAAKRRKSARTSARTSARSALRSASGR